MSDTPLTFKAQSARINSRKNELREKCHGPGSHPLGSHPLGRAFGREVREKTKGNGRTSLVVHMAAVAF